MKRGTLEHPKTRALASSLGVPLAQAVGHLEALFHWTARYAPAGDIGRWADNLIAAGCLWEPGGATAADFIEKLILIGWLERNDQHRLVVHDWSEHADDAVQKRLLRARAKFCNGRKPYKRQGLPSSKRGATAARRRRDNSVPARAVAVPEPEPGPSHTRRTVRANDNGSPHASSKVKTAEQQALESAIYREKLFNLFDDARNLSFAEIAQEVVREAAGLLFDRRAFKELAGAQLEPMLATAWQLLRLEIPKIEVAANRRELLIARAVEAARVAGEIESGKVAR